MQTILSLLSLLVVAVPAVVIGFVWTGRGKQD